MLQASIDRSGAVNPPRTPTGQGVGIIRGIIGMKIEHRLMSTGPALCLRCFQAKVLAQLSNHMQTSGLDALLAQDSMVCGVAASALRSRLSVIVMSLRKPQSLGYRCST